MKKMIVCLTALLLVLPMLATAVTAADDWTVSVRIVGLGEDIYNAEVSVAEGASAGDALAAVEGVEIVGLDSYITEVDGIAAGMFGGWDGWNYRVNGKSPSVGINDYALGGRRRRSALLRDVRYANPRGRVCGRRSDLHLHGHDL